MRIRRTGETRDSAKPAELTKLAKLARIAEPAKCANPRNSRKSPNSRIRRTRQTRGSAELADPLNSPNSRVRQTRQNRRRPGTILTTTGYLGQSHFSISPTSELPSVLPRVFPSWQRRSTHRFALRAPVLPRFCPGFCPSCRPHRFFVDPPPISVDPPFRRSRHILGAAKRSS